MTPERLKAATAGGIIRKEFIERCQKFRFPIWQFWEICQMRPGEWDAISRLQGVDMSETPEDEAVREIVEANKRKKNGNQGA